MSKYETVQDCAVDIICREGDRLNNRQIAEKVRKIMGSKTSPGCISWYKTHINNGDIKVNRNQHRGEQIHNGFNHDNLEKKNIPNNAEKYVCEIEKKRIGKTPKQSLQNSHLGYDFDSGDRHIEVKSQKKGIKKWLTLTPNESEILIKDPKYWLYLVEGDFEKNPDDIKLYMIPKEDLLAMAQLKITVRLTRLGNKTKRKEWREYTAPNNRAGLTS